jgi:pimeloyl-ACP methyl ester carboxylesterase
VAAGLVVAVIGASGCNSQRFLETEDGVRLAYEVHGSGPDTVIVPLASHIAADWVEKMATDRVMIFYDPRARGASSRPADSMHVGFEYDVQDLEAVRRHLGVGEAHLIGWSYYGAVVATYAARHPEHVRHLVLVAPMPIRADAPYWEELNERAQRVNAALLERFRGVEADGWEERDPQVFCRAKMRFVDAPPMMGDPTALMAMQAEPCQYENEWPAQLDPTFERIFNGLGDWDFRETAEAVTSPTFVIHGEEDKIPRAASVEWAESIPNNYVWSAVQTGHYVWLEAVVSFYYMTDTFLNGQIPPGAIRIRSER